jgi:hypothetical protein
MKCLCRILLGCTTLLIATSTLAQSSGQLPPARQASGGTLASGLQQPGPPPLIGLAAQKSVQADLKLKKTQAERLQAAETKVKKTVMDALRAGPQEIVAKMESALKDSDKELAEVLSEEQMTRLRQIAMQLQGPQALLAPEVSEKLQLTEEQVSKIKKLNRKDEKKLNAILTEEQRTKRQEMIGRPFHGKIAPPPPGMPLPRN